MKGNVINIFQKLELNVKQLGGLEMKTILESDAEDIEALTKLDEAIQALKIAGYEFVIHTIVDTETAGNNKDFHKRIITMKCHKYFPVLENEEVTGIRKLTSFSGGPTC